MFKPADAPDGPEFPDRAKKARPANGDHCYFPSEDRISLSEFEYLEELAAESAGCVDWWQQPVRYYDALHIALFCFLESVIERRHRMKN
jgi:hypothetical protein